MNFDFIKMYKISYNVFYEMILRKNSKYVYTISLVRTLSLTDISRQKEFYEFHSLNLSRIFMHIYLSLLYVHLDR